jgi:hypothetical protein
LQTKEVLLDSWLNKPKLSHPPDLAPLNSNLRRLDPGSEVRRQLLARDLRLVPARRSIHHSKQIRELTWKTSLIKLFEFRSAFTAFRK